jgi:hypothetical protein
MIMTTIIPTFIILLLGIALGAVVGSLWGLGQHRHIYDWLSASLISRMQQAMRSCGYSQEEEDGCRRYKVVTRGYGEYPSLPHDAISDVQHFFYDFTHGNVLPIEYKVAE